MLYALLRCPLCKSQQTTSQGCCRVCAEQLARLTPIYQTEQVMLGSYQGLLERAIRAYKFHAVLRLERLFATQLARILAQTSWSPDLITAVPLHPKRQRERGYNQSERLARQLASQLELPYKPLLKRNRMTRQQARLSAAERQANVKNAFDIIRPARAKILLVDDVVTSGATTHACAETLKRAGAKQVWVAALAQAPLK